MAFFEHDDCSLHYEEYGQGDPVLLLHGLGSSCQDWEYQIPMLHCLSLNLVLKGIDGY